MPPDPQKELLIWWTSNSEAIGIGEEAPAALPEYVREQFRGRRGFCVGVGTPTSLWVDQKFGARAIAEWPDTFFGRMLKDGTSQGIVFTRGDLLGFRGMPGLVTDFKLRMLVI